MRAAAMPKSLTCSLVGSEMDEIFNSMATIEDLEISLVVDGGSD